MGKIATWVLLGLAGFSLTACQKGPPWKPPAPIVDSALAKVAHKGPAAMA